LAVGWGTWGLVVVRRFSPRFSFLLYLLPVGLGLALVSLNLYVLLRVIPGLGVGLYQLW
jgi:hypothetical protein